MTLLNIYTTGNRALLVTDTAMTLGDGPPRYGTKFDLLPHLHGVLAARGRTLMHRTALDALNLLLLARNVAEVPEVLPDHLRTWEKIHVDNMRDEGSEPGPMETIIWFAGFDFHAARCRVFSFYSEEGYEAVERGPGLHLNPDFGQELPQTVTLDQMVKVAKLQRQLMQAQNKLPGHERLFPDIGGELWGLEVADSGFTCRKLYVFPDKERLAA